MNEAKDTLEGGQKQISQVREITLLKSIANLVAHFIGLGDTKDDAEAKVKALSAEIRTANGGLKFDYVLGDTQPLIDQVNASALVHMDAAAKLIVADILTPV